MTVPTGLIAEFTDIDLKDGDPGGVKREQADVIELRLEGGAARGPPEHLQLLRWGGEGAMLSQQAQRHTILLLNGETDLGVGHPISVRARCLLKLFLETAAHNSRNPRPVLACLPGLVGSREKLCNTPVCRPDVPRPGPSLEEYGDDGRHGVENTLIPAQDPSRIFHR